MPKDSSLQEESPVINIDKLQDLLSLYKFPLVLAGIGIFLFIISISLVVKSQRESEPLFFQEEATSSAKRKIRVDIQGEVLTPGVYELPEGSRIIDALAIAGGLSEKADREHISKTLNRAAKVVDGGKLYIPSTGETSTSQSKNLSTLGSVSTLGTTSKTISINNASQKELETLSGIGPVTAGKIMAGRPYQTIEELKEKKIVGTKLFEKIKDLITVY